MGKKVLTLVASVALAVAVSVAAPGLGAAFLKVIGTQAATALASAAATGLAGAVISLAGGLLLQQIGTNPERRADGTLCPSWTRTEARSPFRTIVNNRWKDMPREEPEAMPVAPVQLSLRRSPVLALAIWAATWIYGPRFWLVRNNGDCMEPALPQGQWVLIDNARSAQPGDIISFMTDDLFINWADDLPLGQHLRTSGMIKQYLGKADGGQVIVFRSMNDPVTGHTGIARLQYLHVVRSSHPTWLAAVRAMLAAYRG